MNLYIIGSVTGIEHDNRPEFERAQEALWKSENTNVVLTPFDCIEGECTWEQAMAQSIITMMTWWRFSLGKVDLCGFGIATLDGWEVSRGARIEHDLAVALGIPVKPWREWL